MRHALSRIAIILLFFAVFTNPRLFADTLHDCYGDSLDIVFLGGTGLDGSVVPEVHLTVPAPDALIISLLDEGRPPLDTVPCRAEPVATNIVTFMSIDPRLGHAAIALPDDLGVRIRMISVGHMQRADVQPGAEIRASRYRTLGEHVGNGLFHYQGGHTAAAIGGGWLLPDTYLSDFQEPITVFCSGFGNICDTRYGLDAQRNLYVSYRFSVEDGTNVPDWIAVDQAIREIVFDWIKE